jgi:hypothetical protein
MRPCTRRCAGHSGPDGRDAYDTWADLERAGEGSREFREEFGSSMGIEVIDTAEFDLAVAQLKVPEIILTATDRVGREEAARHPGRRR